MKEPEAALTGFHSLEIVQHYKWKEAPEDILIDGE